MDEVLSFPWDTFLQLQISTDTPCIGARGHACDDALNRLLEEMAVGAQPPSPAEMERRYRMLTSNRAKKYRYRAALADQIAHHEHIRHGAPDACDATGAKELAALLVGGLVPEDRQLVFAVLGVGMPYRQIASALGKPVGTLKARVSRLRRRLRDGDVRRAMRRTAVAA